jgi:hypothetical protein
MKSGKIISLHYNHLYIPVLLFLMMSMQMETFAKGGQKIDTLYANPTTGAMFRWWLPAAFMEYDEIDAEFKTIAEKGFKGFELCINMADTRYSKEELRENGWATENWNNMYKYMLQKANEYGIQLDVTISPAWPAAVTTITPEDNASTKGLVHNSTDVFSGIFNGKITAPDLSKILGPEGPGGPPPGAPDGFPGNENSENVPPPRDAPPMETDTHDNVPNRPVLIAVVAAKITGTDKVTKTVVRQWGDMPYNPEEKTFEVTLLDPDNLIVLTDLEKNEEENSYDLKWTAPEEGNWQIFSFWMVGSAQTNKQGDATFEPCYVINHFSKDGTDAIIDFWNKYLLDDETRELQRKNGGDIFEDSFEVNVKGMFWSAEMPEEFKKRRGYDLTPFLPVILGSGSSGIAFLTGSYELDNGEGQTSDAGDKIRNDFNQLLTDLYIDYHIKPIQEWAKTMGMGYRAQCYGMPADMIALSATAFAPDVESLGFGPGSLGDDRYRLMAGGAHMAGRKFVSSEVGAISNEGYRLTWKDMLVWINKGYAGGSNQMVFHGFPYAKSNSSIWPGYTPFGFGLSGYWGPRQPGWNNIEEYAAHLSRTQNILQSGQPQVDVAVYYHKYDLFAKIIEDQNMARTGYTYEYISPNIFDLPGVIVKNGILNPVGPSYKALILNNQKHMTAETAQKLLNFAQNGLKIIIAGEIPSRISYYKNYKAEEKLLAETFEKLLQLNVVKVVASEADLVNALQSFGISPGASYKKSSKLSNVHRIIDCIDYYYLYNYSDTDIDMDVTFKGKGIPYDIDQWSGEIRYIGDFHQSENTITVKVRLLPQETVIYAFDPTGTLHSEKIQPNVFSILTNSVNNIQDISSNWEIEVESWENAHNPENSNETRKTNIRIGKSDLKPWKDIDVLGDPVSGIGMYKKILSVDKKLFKGERVFISLGEVDGCSASMWINGNRLYLNPFTYVAEIGERLKEGENIIEVKVTSTLGNRLIKDGSITVPSWDPTAKVEYEKYGLVGPVKLICTD